MLRDSVMSNAPRMSLSALNMMDDPDRQVRIWLLSATTVKGAVFYRVAGRFSSSGQTWQVNRRYSEFLVLRDTLIKYFSRTTDTCPGCVNYLHSIKQFDFPKKHLFVSKSQIVINYRIQALRQFMNLLASWAFSNSPKCPTCGGFAFDIVRNFCLEGAEAVGDSNMSYIRESFVVSTFTEAGRRSSLSRRNSFTPGLHTPNGHQQRVSEQQRSTMAGRPDDARAARRGDEGAYVAFNNYLVRQSSQERKTVQSRGSINIPQHRRDDSHGEHDRANGSSRGSRALPRSSSSTSSGRTPQQSASAVQPPSMPSGSFLFYQDGVDRGHSTASSHHASSAHDDSTNGSQRGVASSTGSKRGILKNWNDVRRDRAQNDSYLSLGASSSADSIEPLEIPRTKQPSSRRGASKNRNDARSDNDSYFSLGASSGTSREENENKKPTGNQRPRPSAATYDYIDQLQQQERRDRSQNDSYLSLGASSTSGDLEEEYHSHHPSVMPEHDDAMYMQPPATQKYVGGSSKKNHHTESPQPSSQRKSQRARSPPPPNDHSSQRASSSQRKSQRARSPPPQHHAYYEYEEDEQPRSSRRHRQPEALQPPPQQRKNHKPTVDESFATDSFVDESLRFDGMGPIAVDDVSDSDDDEIDVTGLAIDPSGRPRKSTSGQDLWQPWELAKAG